MVISLCVVTTDVIDKALLIPIVDHFFVDHLPGAPRTYTRKWLIDTTYVLPTIDCASSVQIAP